MLFFVVGTFCVYVKMSTDNEVYILEPLFLFKGFRSRCREGIIVKLCCKWRRVVNSTFQPLHFREGTTIPFEQEAAWAPKSPWTFRKG